MAYFKEHKHKCEMLLEKEELKNLHVYNIKCLLVICSALTNYTKGNMSYNNLL